MSNFVQVQDLLEEEKKGDSKISLLGTEKTEGEYMSQYFKGMSEIMSNLFSPSEEYQLQDKIDVNTQEETETESSRSVVPTDNYAILGAWKNIENYSARMIEVNDELVILECLIDREKDIFEERAFKTSLFKGYDATIGTTYYIRIFERNHELKMQIHDDPKSNYSADFAKTDIVKELKDSKLFK